MANPENKQIPYESTQKDIRDAIESVATAIGGIAIPSADHVSYDNSGSGLSATDVQNALDEIVSDIPTVNDGTLTIQQNGETKGTFTANQSGNSTVNIETPTTDIQTAVDEFETYNGGLLSECKVALSPNQDLHGYDSPWVGGAGKNKLPLVLADIKALNTEGTWNGNVYTINGGTITIDTDVDGNAIDIKANGTFTARTILNITMPTNNYHPTSGSYIINKSYQNASTAIIIDAYNNNTWVQTLARSSSVDDVQFTLDYSGYDRLSIYLEILNGTSANNIILKPMIRLATESDPTFEPYTNICPISGHTQVEVDVSDGQTTQEQITVQIGQTVYGGTVDLVSGDGVSTENLVNLDRNWSGQPNTYFYCYVGTNYTEVIESDAFEKSNEYNVTTAHTKTNIMAYNSATGNLMVYAPDYIDTTTFKNAVSDFNALFNLKEASYNIFALAPQQIETLVGENHLSAPLEGQEITESKYKQMFTFDDVIAYIQSLS